LLPVTESTASILLVVIGVRTVILLAEAFVIAVIIPTVTAVTSLQYHKYYFIVVSA
jgi:hypothetical protein